MLAVWLAALLRVRGTVPTALLVTSCPPTVKVLAAFLCAMFVRSIPTACVPESYVIGAVAVTTPVLP
jgi:hypothetical protein